MKKVLVIMGSTASGKSEIGIELAKMLQSEIISCDSVQVYKPLNIGSAKITNDEGITHHMIDIMELEDEMNVMTFQQMARKHIQEINDKHKIPICVGGTGFYIKAMLYDYQFIEHQNTKDFSHLSNEQLHQQLQDLDPVQAMKIHVNNRQRLVRVFQQMDAAQQTRSQLHDQQKHEILYDAMIFYLTTDRETLYQRINQRVDEMFDEGLLEEVRKVSKNGTDFTPLGLKSIGYKEFEPYFNNEMSLEETKEQIKRNTRRFSKRQMTWFKHQLVGQLVDIQNEDEIKDMKDKIKAWINS